MGEKVSLKAISENLIIKAPVDQVYKAWTTKEGIKSFFAPDCNIELKIMGPYEIIFLPDGEEGSKGGEGNVVLSFQENKMLSFTWNSPPEMKKVRNERTHVLLLFIPLNKNETKLIFQQDGWGEGGEWDKSFEYFEHAWKNVVLPRLKYSLEVGPVDCKRPPEFN
jgi:uncharacterized protein YndB with AHSA1/START domain